MLVVHVNFSLSLHLKLPKSHHSFRHICEAVSENNDTKSQSLRDQWYQLILQPMSRLDGNFPQLFYILVIDALDECEGENNICAILQLLAEARRSLKKVRLQVFLTSRPEIRSDTASTRYHMLSTGTLFFHNISPSIKDHDIRIFLEYSFKLIGQERSLDADWPGRQVIKSLVQRASGLFIWAANAHRFISDGNNSQSRD